MNQSGKFMSDRSFAGVIGEPNPLHGRSRIVLEYGLKTNKGHECIMITLTIRFTGYTPEETVIAGCTLDDARMGYQLLYKQHKSRRGYVPDSEKVTEDTLMNDFINNLSVTFRNILQKEDH